MSVAMHEVFVIPGPWFLRAFVNVAQLREDWVQAMNGSDKVKVTKGVVRTKFKAGHKANKPLPTEVEETCCDEWCWWCCCVRTPKDRSDDSNSSDTSSLQSCSDSSSATPAELAATQNLDSWMQDRVDSFTVEVSSARS